MQSGSVSAAEKIFAGLQATSKKLLNKYSKRIKQAVNKCKLHVFSRLNSQNVILNSIPMNAWRQLNLRDKGQMAVANWKIAMVLQQTHKYLEGFVAEGSLIQFVIMNRQISLKDQPLSVN